MPTLDVSEAFDPSFFDDIVVIRRTETIDQHGRSTRGEKAMSAKAVVVAASPDDLNRLPEGEYMNKAVSITTMFRLQGPAPGYQPDEIIWNGSHMIVRALDDFSRYGRGFVHAVAVSMDSVDPPPMPDPVGSA